MNVAIIVQIEHCLRHHPSSSSSSSSEFIFVDELFLALGVVEMEVSTGGVVGSGHSRVSHLLDADLDVVVAEGLTPGVWLGAPSLVSTPVLKPRRSLSAVAGRGGQQRGLAAKLRIISC